MVYCVCECTMYGLHHVCTYTCYACVVWVALSVCCVCVVCVLCVCCVCVVCVCCVQHTCAYACTAHKFLKGQLNFNCRCTTMHTTKTS